MFNWTTTTLINELPFIKAETGKLRIGKHLFEKRWVESIRKAEGHAPTICSAGLDFAKIQPLLAAENATVARLYIYVGLEGSEESIYANDWYRKGMPLSVSFAANGTAQEMVANIIDTVNRFNVFTKVKKVLSVDTKKVTNSGTTTETKTTLVISGTHEHQRIQKLQILIDGGQGEEVAIVDYEVNRKEAAATGSDATVVDVVKGVNGFGTYSQLLKDLRLPTAVHNNWLSVQKDEMPIVGALYTQYIINYYAPSTANPSFTAVGNRSMSETTHVFWVKSDLVTEWETALAAIDPDATGLETVVVEADKRYVNKKKSLVDRVETLETTNA